MTVYPLGDQRLMIRRNLALLEVKSAEDWRTVEIYKLPVIAHELSPHGRLGRFVAIYEAENDSFDLRERLTLYRGAK
jgi:hypothetical protein